MPAPTKPLLAVLSGGNAEKPPIWLMRQAGRYLPEYRALRAEKGGFLELGLRPRGGGRGHAPADPPLRLRRRDPVLRHPDRAATRWARTCASWRARGRASRRRSVDAALAALQRVPARLAPIYATVEKVKAALSRRDTTLLGFAGSPWTVATYMVAGQGSRDQAEARRSPIAIPAAFAAIIDAIVGDDDRLSVRPDRGRGRGGAIVRQLGRQPCAGRVRALGDRADRARSSRR